MRLRMQAERRVVESSVAISDASRNDLRAAGRRREPVPPQTGPRSVTIEVARSEHLQYDTAHIGAAAHHRHRGRTGPPGCEARRGSVRRERRRPRALGGASPPDRGPRHRSPEEEVRGHLPPSKAARFYRRRPAARRTRAAPRRAARRQVATKWSRCASPSLAVSPEHRPVPGTFPAKGRIALRSVRSDGYAAPLTDALD